MNSALLNYYAGLSGIVLPVPKYLFPESHQNASRLNYYSTFFNSLEVNSTFYKLPMPKTVVKWVSEVPESFKFTFKLWREITHMENLDFKEQDVGLFFSVIAGAGHKKGCVLVQFPPSLTRAHVRQLETLLVCIGQYNANHEWKIAVEFRHRSWYHEDIYKLLEDHRASLVLQDIPKSAAPLISTADFIYARFHGPQGNYKDSYSESFLAEYATYIREWLQEGKTVYAYFNNTAGDAFPNLKTLNQFVYSP
jgi:uncharacterized protein YecE (DUF72 family)